MANSMHMAAIKLAHGPLTQIRGGMNRDPPVHAKNTVHQIGNKTDVMRDQHNRQGPVQIPEASHEPPLIVRVDHGSGFIKKENFRLRRESPRDEHTLALSTRQIRVKPVRLVTHSHLFKHPLDNLFIDLSEPRPTPAPQPPHAHDLAHSDGKACVEGHLLRHIADARTRP